MTVPPKRRNPQDLTHRNRRALDKRVTALEAAIVKLRKDFTALAQRGTKR